MNILSKFQLSVALRDLERRFVEYLEEKTDSPIFYESMSDKSVCRTAQATPGL